MGTSLAGAQTHTFMTGQRPAVRPFFRILGLVAGPLTGLGGVVFLLMSIRALATGGWGHWWPENKDFTISGVVGIAFGILITRAAVTGKDPT